MTADKFKKINIFMLSQTIFGSKSKLYISDYIYLLILLLYQLKLLCSGAEINVYLHVYINIYIYKVLQTSI